ncbi:MAG: response regulator [Kiritimatiellia bacterium]
MPHILVVDDEKSIRLTLRAFLQDQGYEVELAEDANHALALLAHGNWDVVLTDIVMPGLSGVGLLKAIRSAAPREVQVIMMTGEPTVATAAEAVRAGACDYLAKPVSKDAILRAVGHAARIKALEDDRRRQQAAKERYQQELQASVKSLNAANEQLRLDAAFREEVEHITHHDLKSPLSIILVAPGLIRMTGGNLTEPQRSYLDMIEEAGHRLLDMINRSLDLFKIEQGMYVFRPEPVNLLGLAREVISHHEDVMRVKNLSAVLQIDDEPVRESDTFMVPGERLLCYSMLGNLVKNAVEASPDGEAVVLRFERGDAMRMSICNQGAVPENIRDRFFAKFSTSGKTHGTGLGTYSAKMIAELHGARISLDTSVNDFTTVTVCFPATPPTIEDLRIMREERV